jgi:hypothetical protein
MRAAYCRRVFDFVEIVGCAGEQAAAARLGTLVDMVTGKQRSQSCAEASGHPQASGLETLAQQGCSFSSAPRGQGSGLRVAPNMVLETLCASLGRPSQEDQKAEKTQPLLRCEARALDLCGVAALEVMQRDVRSAGD